MKTAQKVNTSLFKKVLALIRDGDFAHAGEQDAINIVFKDIEKNSRRNVLDVGCGLGGTAAIVQQQGYGQVVGIDILSGTIQHAKQKYPEANFMDCDVLDVASKIKQKFELIYLFNSFYAFLQQKQALMELRKVATENAELVIFDYTDLGNYEQNRPEAVYDVVLHPIKPDQINLLTEQTGWRIYKQQDLTEEYKRWYEVFVARIEQKHAEIVNAADEETYQYAYNVYANILSSIRGGYLGGAVFYAKRAAR